MRTTLFWILSAIALVAIIATVVTLIVVFSDPKSKDPEQLISGTFSLQVFKTLDGVFKVALFDTDDEEVKSKIDLSLSSWNTDDSTVTIDGDIYYLYDNGDFLLREDKPVEDQIIFKELDDDDGVFVLQVLPGPNTFFMRFGDLGREDQNLKDLGFNAQTYRIPERIVESPDMATQFIKK